MDFSPAYELGHETLVLEVSSDASQDVRERDIEDHVSKWASGLWPPVSGKNVVISIECKPIVFLVLCDDMPKIVL